MYHHHPSNSNSSSFNNGNDLIISSSSSAYPIIHQQQQPFFYSNRPFSSTIESNPSNSSKDNNELDQTNCDTLPLPLSLSFFQFPCSPFEDNEIFPQHNHHHDDDDDLFLHHHHHHQSLAPSAPPPLPPETTTSGVANMEVSITTTTEVIPPKSTPTPTTTHHVLAQHHQIPIMRRRSSKRDRHSKIKTARGLRDRRMRLSLDVAKRFFGLQDMLGFDKASKTVEWLLNQAKSEIKQLAREKKNHPSYDNNNCSSSLIVGDKSASSTSECIEGVSSLDEVAVSGNQGQKEGEKVVPTTSKVKKRSRTNNRLSRKSAFNTIGKESREKARERARERTREKMMRTKANNNNKQCNNNEEIVMTNNNNSRSLSRLGSWNPFESTVEESQISVNPSSFDVVLVEAETEERSSSQAKDNNNNNNQNHHLGNCCVDEDSLVIMSRWSPTMILNSLNNPAILQEHQFAEFQPMGKPWEAYNNHI